MSNNTKQVKSKKIRKLVTIVLSSITGVATALCLVAFFVPDSFASSADFNQISQGRLINDADGSIIFDAEDITTLNNNIGLVENSITALDTTVTGLDSTVTQLNTDVENAKTQLKDTLMTYSNAKTLPLETFTDLNTAVNSLTKLDTTNPYYYDTTTGTDNAAEIKRYKKVDGLYYLCNKNGEITDQTAQTVDENNLAQYVAADQENLTAGTAGYVNKTLYLGDGSDNITYRNLGYQQACDENWSKSDVSITRHTHVDSCYCLGNMIVYEKLTIGSGDNKYTIRFQCSSCGALGQGNSNKNWYDSYNIGDLLAKHYYTQGLAWISGQWKNKKCSYEDNQVISVKINGVEYIN